MPQYNAVMSQGCFLSRPPADKCAEQRSGPCEVQVTSGPEYLRRSTQEAIAPLRGEPLNMHRLGPRSDVLLRERQNRSLAFSSQ